MILYVNRMATMGKVSARRVLGASSDRRGASVLAVGTPRHTVHNKKNEKIENVRLGWWVGAVLLATAQIQAGWLQHDFGRAHIDHDTIYRP